jgi:hypothetical protein
MWNAVGTDYFLNNFLSNNISNIYLFFKCHFYTVLKFHGAKIPPIAENNYATRFAAHIVTKLNKQKIGQLYVGDGGRFKVHFFHHI